jgi:asparagine synthase (glutamine-hydrolysing)
MPPAEHGPLLARALREACTQFDPYGDLVGVAEGIAGLTPLDRLIYLHCKFYLAEQNLVCQDRASMASGLEVRAPFLDRPLVELAGQIPGHLKVHGLTTRYVLKRALAGDLPEEILRRYKQGFSSPVGHWMRGPLRPALEERLGPERVSRLGLFEAAAIGRLVTEHVEGRRDHGYALWMLMMFDAWREHYLPHARWS